MAKPKILTNPAGTTLPSDYLEWNEFTVVGTGFSTVSKVTVKKAKYPYYVAYSHVYDANNDVRDDLLNISVTRKSLNAVRGLQAIGTGDSDNLTYTVSNPTESDQATVVIVYD